MRMGNTVYPSCMLDNASPSCMLDNASPVVAMVMYSNNKENKFYAITLQITIPQTDNMYGESNCILP